MSQIKTSPSLTKKILAKELGISRSSLYYRSKQKVKDWQFKIRIEEALHQEPSYGHKRLAPILKAGKNRVLRVMKLFGIKPYRRRGRKPWKKASNELPAYPNLLLEFTPSGPNQVWVSDFTHVVFKGRMLYIATVMDIWTREIIGFSVSASHSVWLIIEALLMALWQRPPPLIIHSDQGSEYKSRAYTSLEESFGIRVSMSRKASPWENGYQESFYSQFKIDLGDPNRFEEKGELIAEIYQTLHHYNTQRIHTSLKMPPRKFAILKTLPNSEFQVAEKVS